MVASSADVGPFSLKHRVSGEYRVESMVLARYLGDANRERLIVDRRREKVTKDLEEVKVGTSFIHHFPNSAKRNSPPRYPICHTSIPQPKRTACNPNEVLSRPQRDLIASSYGQNESWGGANREQAA
ncbi:hypothetical protein CDAR_207711 [Caerostris darwini]|uniref:Uncharacterized protein n=1 Tax=Caerostris darwini TaxID=1538125 RepID=A0AAV4WV49_9ARAC|nr:hypothetical protein CDAR_207711 [Caerostris darwini]